MGTLNTVSFLCSFGAYALVAWAYITYIDRDGSFWLAMGVLVGVRFLFSIIDGLGSFFAWRIYGRQHSIRSTLQFLAANKFPMRKYAWDSGETYLFRMKNQSDTPGVSDETRGQRAKSKGYWIFSMRSRW